MEGGGGWFKGYDLGDEGIANQPARGSHFFYLIRKDDKWLRIVIFMFGSKDKIVDGLMC
jgi:hypothetical protein